MPALVEYLTELASLVQTLEAAVASGGDIPEASGGQLFEWRIRARIVEDKLYQASKPPGREKSEEEKATEMGAAPPVFSEAVQAQAQRALPMVAALRAALQNKRLKIALEYARALAFAIA